MHGCLIHVVDAGYRVVAAFSCCNDEVMKPHNVLFEVGGQSLGQSCFFSHADRVASFPFLIPSTGSFERRMIKELFSFNPFPSKRDSV